MQLFFTDSLSSDYVSLNAEESKHCVKVLRMTVGDDVCLTDGQGTLAHAEVVTPDARACVLHVVSREPHYQQRSWHLHVAVAPTKNSARLEWFIEKAVEMGIDEITPILCDHSERGVLKTDRLEKIVLSAAKQSLKAYLPVIHEPVRLAQFLASLPVDGLGERRLICYCEGDERVRLTQHYAPGDNALVLIGPEGDFSSAEVQAALFKGFHPITLGTCRLRTETAALYAVTALNFLNS